MNATEAALIFDGLHETREKICQRTPDNHMHPNVAAKGRGIPPYMYLYRFIGRLRLQFTFGALSVPD